MVLTVALDFDGVLNTYDGWCGSDELFEPREGVWHFLAMLHESFRVVVFTCRDVGRVWDWLVCHGLAVYVSDVTNVKPRAFVYVDDRGYCFDGDFDKALGVIKNFSAFWEGG